MADSPRLTEEQRAIVEAVSGPVRILAGAGTGKTTTISHRIAEQVRSGAFAPGQILAVTFTRNSATWLRDHLARQGVPGVQADTFHAAALRIVRRWWPEWRGTDFPKTVESKLPHLGPTPASVDRRTVAADIEWLKRQRATPETTVELLARTRYETSLPATDLSRLFGNYEARKQRAGLLDFEDMMELCIRLLEQHEPARDWFDENHLAFTVDEFQDVDPLQFALLASWVGTSDDICVVGDGYQAIYGFKGSSSGYLDEFPRWQPETRTFPLTTNFRSTVEVLAPANALARYLPGTHRRLTSDRRGHAPVIRGFASGSGETADLIGRIQGLSKQGVALEDMAILYRLNSQSARYEEALTKARIPHQVADGDFLHRYHVRAAIRSLVGATTVEEARERANAMAAQARESADSEEDLSRSQDLSTLARLVERFEGSGFSDPSELPGWLRDVQGQQMNGVHLMTYHRAKGLEFEAVFLPELQQGLLPFGRSVKEGGMQDERRLLYVGLTRAKTYLSVSWATSDPQRRLTPSQFIAELDGRVTAPRVEPARKKPRRAAPAEIDPDAGETLLSLTEREFATAFTRRGRFAESGWSLQGQAPFRCADCGGELAVCRKPFIRYGQAMRFFAILCRRCQTVLEPKELSDAHRKALKRWSETR